MGEEQVAEKRVSGLEAHVGSIAQKAGGLQ